MQKILIIANSDLVIYKFRKEIVEALIKQGYEVSLLAPAGIYTEDLKGMGCKYHSIKMDRRGTNLIKDLILMGQYQKIVKKEKPDIILTYTIKPNIYGGIISRMNGIPYIANITGLGSAIVRNEIIHNLTKLLYKIAFKKSSCIFFQNRDNLNYFKENGLLRGKNILLPGSGVNLKEYKGYEYPQGRMEFLFIARVMREKGIEEYLETAKYIKKKYPNTKFHVLGFCEEKYEERLAEYEKRGIIKYHGQVKDTQAYLEKGHCIIHPSYGEGMSNVCLESAASKRPVITTDSCGCRETVEDGKTGYIVKKGNAQELIKAVEKFLELKQEERREMGIKGREKMELEFNRDIIVDIYLSEINRILTR